MPMPSLALAGTGQRAVKANDLLDLFPRAFDVGGRQVDLVDDRDNLEVGLQREVDVGERLGLDPLGGIHRTSSAPSQAASARDTS